MKPRTWTRTVDDGSTLTVSIDAVGAAVSVQHIHGAREGHAVSFEAFEAEWLPWLAEPFDDALDEMRDAVDAARAEADDLDDLVP